MNTFAPVFNLLKNKINCMHLKEDIDKLGNTIIYLSERMPDLSKTKLLKILYFLDEYRIKTTGLPFLNLKYEVWQFGPVSQEVFVDLNSDELTILKDYINVSIDGDGRRYITAKEKFNDDEFTDSELEFLEHVTVSFIPRTAKELVELSHAKGSLWYSTAKDNDLLEAFEYGLTNSSNVEIDFRNLVKTDEKKLSFYNDYLKFHESLKQFKTI